MSAAETLRLRVQALVARGLAAPEVARRVGLAAASEVWGGDVPRDRAAWYVWLRDRPGAWQLELSGAERLPGAASWILGRLVVRHYPAPSGPLLAEFDPEEQAAARASLDATGTPRIDAASRLGPHLFTVGTVDWALDLERDASVLTLSSQDRLRVRHGDRLVRDVPGWTLAAPILALLGGLHAQLEGRRASRLVVTRAPGFELVVEDGARSPRDARDVVHGEASLVFTAADGCGRPGAALLEAGRDPDAELVRDDALAGEGLPDAADASTDPRLALEVSRAWFGGERHFEGASCAC